LFLAQRSFERAHLDFARPFRREAHPDAPLNAPPREPAYKLDPDWCARAAGNRRRSLGVARA